MTLTEDSKSSAVATANNASFAAIEFVPVPRSSFAMAWSTEAWSRFVTQRRHLTRRIEGRSGGGGPLSAAFERSRLTRCTSVLYRRMHPAILFFENDDVWTPR
jgi:hypothetical protein